MVRIRNKRKILHHCLLSQTTEQIGKPARYITADTSAKAKQRLHAGIRLEISQTQTKSVSITHHKQISKNYTAFRYFTTDRYTKYTVTHYYSKQFGLAIHKRVN